MVTDIPGTTDATFGKTPIFKISSDNLVYICVYILDTDDEINKNKI